MRRIILSTILFASLLVPASAQESTPRAVAERVAAAVEENFFDEARAQQIAAEVRAAASAGRYDLSDPAELAAALSATLRPHDGHFRVEYTPPNPNPAALPPAFGNDARAAYGVPSVTMYPGGVGAIDLRLLAHFTPDDEATLPAKRAVDAAMTLVSGAQALILDLHDCAGGSPAMVGYLVGHFVAEDADVYNTFRGRDRERRETPPAPPATGRRLDTPLFIVISGRTGSACESVAYTLQAAGRATIVGNASAGGANPGGLIPVGDNLAVFVSGATPINPITGRNWEGAGVQPDVAAANGEALTRARELALDAALQAPANEGAAVEARWALDALRAERAPYPRRLCDYAGEYGPRRVAIDNGRLTVIRDRRPPLILLPVAADEFAVADVVPLQRVRFERDARGRVSAMTLSLVGGQQFRDLRQR